MAASYPASAKSFSTLNAGDVVQDTDIEAAYDEIAAIEAELVSTGLTNALKVNAGIVFPASQAASSNANTLDDYQEEAFTPALSFGGGTTGLTYAVQSGQAVKVGKNQFFKGIITLTAKGSSTGAAKITGLPVAEGDNVNCAITIGPSASFSGLTGALVGMVDNNAASITLHQSAATGSAAITDAVFTDTTTITFSGWYRAAA